MLGRKQKALLLFLDALFFIGFAYVLFGLRLATWDLSLLLGSTGLLFSLFIQSLSHYVFGLYEIEPSSSKLSLTIRAFISLVLAFSIIVIVNFIFQKERSGIFGRGILGGVLGGVFVWTFLTRSVVQKILTALMVRNEWIAIGNQKYLSRFEQDLKAGHFVAQMFYFNETEVEKAKLRLGEKLSGIVVAIDETTTAFDQELSHLLIRARLSGVKILALSSFYEKYWKKEPVFYLKPSWFLEVAGFENAQNPVNIRLKRLCDFLFATVLFVVTLPLMLLTAFVVVLESPGGALYKQIRTGKDGKEFFIYKFRSMRSDAEKNGAQWAAKNDARITRVGNFIRKTRLDELPQLWNILVGEMSFVGPRPERPEFNQDLEKKIPYYNLRHSVRPGLTGWAQVLYPYGASIEDSMEKLQFELYYIRHYSLIFDLSIVLKTVRVVLFGRGR